MSKQGGQQTVSQTVDPQTQAYVDYMRRVAMGYAGLPGPGGAGGGAPNTATGPLGSQFGNPWNLGARGGAGGIGAPITPPANPALNEAISQYGQYAKGGQLGFGALTGDPNAVASFMNPYLQTLNPYFDQIRGSTLSAIGADATNAGAFGGTRQGVAEGQALGNIANTQAQVGYGAFNDAMQRALQAANLGYGAIGQGAFLPQQYAQGQLGLLGSALGPYGQTTSQPLYRNRLAGALGGASAGSAFGPWGALGGGLLGAFG